jgi:integrase
MGVPSLRLTDAMIEELVHARRIVGATRTGRPIVDPKAKPVHDWYVRDVLVHDLMLRFTPQAATWCMAVKVNGKLLRRSLGNAATWDGGVRRGGMKVETARNACRQFRSMMVSGLDPYVERQRVATDARSARDRQRTVMRVAFDTYIEQTTAKSRESTNKDRGKVRKWLDKSPLWSLPVIEVDQYAVKATYQPIYDALMKGTKKPEWGPKSLSPGTLDKLYIYPQAAWVRAAADLKHPTSPSPFALWRDTVKWPKKERKSSFLDTGDEKGKEWLRSLVRLQQRFHHPNILSARPDPRSRDVKPHASVLVDFFLCLLLWGTRKTETALLKVDDVHFDRGYVRLNESTTKTGKDAYVPLTPWASQILRDRIAMNKSWRNHENEEGWVFPSRQHGKPINNPRRILLLIKEETGLWITAHDLRRTLATELGKIENVQNELARLLVAGAALHHAQGRTGGVVAAATEGYIQEQVNALRPLFQEREDRLRAIVDLPPLSKKSKKNRAADPASFDALLKQATKDESLRRQLIEALLGR